MTKVLMTIFLFANAYSVFAAPQKCDLQVLFRTGVYGEPASYFEDVKSVLKAKGYTNIQLIESNAKFKKLLLSFGTETPSFNYTEKAWMVLTDETKVTTDEKNLFFSKRGSYLSGAAQAYLKLLRELPNCRF